MATEQQNKKFQKLLDEEWMDAIRGTKHEDKLNDEIKQSAMNLVTLEMAQKLDEDLIRLQDELKTAREQYTEGKKVNLCKIEFVLEIMRDRGLPVPSVSDFVKVARREKKPQTPEEIANEAGKQFVRGVRGAVSKDAKVSFLAPDGESYSFNSE